MVTCKQESTSVSSTENSSHDNRMVAHDNLITIEDRQDNDIVVMTTLERLLPNDSHILRALTEPDPTPHEVRHGLVLLLDTRGPPCPARLTLTEDNFIVQKEELVYASTDSDNIDPALLTKERSVTIQREKIGGLGLSVKGGAEHNLPVLISRIFKDQAADKTGKLFVGDAIIKVNNNNIENACHDDAVKALKNAGDDVTLLVKYFRPASLFLNRNRRTDRDEENNTAEEEEPRLERQWTTVATLPLHCAYVTRYERPTDKLRLNSFEVVALNGSTSGILQCEDSQSLGDWLQCINHNINLIANQTMVLNNKLLVPSQQIVHTSWIWQRTTPTQHWETWRPVYLAFKGPDLLLFDTPPIKQRDWARCENKDRIYECMFRILKESEYLDARQHCFLIQTGQGVDHYVSVESRQELLRVEKAWYRANYLAVKYLGNKTFGCTWRGQLSGFTLDLNSGFSLYDSETKSYRWNYRFSQLKGSSDDGKSKLQLLFLNDTTQQVETRDIECTNLKSLLFAMHAFLSAKLATVDPAFLTNL